MADAAVSCGTTTFDAAVAASLDVGAGAAVARVFSAGPPCEPLALSHDGRGVWCRVDAGLALVDVESGAEVKRFAAGDVWQLAVSPDGTRLGTGGDDGTPWARLLDVDGRVIAEDRDLRKQHAQLGFSGDSRFFVVAHTWFDGPWPLHVFDRDGAAQPHRQVLVEPRRVQPASGGRVLVGPAWNGVQVVDLDGGPAHLFDTGIRGSYDVAVADDRVVIAQHGPHLSLRSLAGEPWPAQRDLDAAQRAPGDALLARLLARREKARSNDHKRFLDDEIKETKKRSKRPDPPDEGARRFHPGVAHVEGVAVAGGAVLACGAQDLVRFDLATLREDVLLSASPAAGKHVILRLHGQQGDAVLVDVQTKSSRARCVLRLLPPPRAALPAPATKTKTKTTKTPVKKTPVKKTPAKKTAAKKTAATTKKKTAAKKKKA